MKPFRKTEDGKFICEECGRICLNLKSLGCHIVKCHKIKTKIYYDNYIKENKDDKCLECDSSTNFNDLKYGYSNFCSYKCSNGNKDNIRNKEETNIKKYGVKYSSMLFDRKQKIIIKGKKTKLKNHGNENYNNIEKSRQTYMKKYGVEHNSQVFSIHEKQQNGRFKKHKFKDTNIWYQASYELDFLNNYYNKFKELQRGPSIKYKYKGKNKIYYSDFYIPSLNLIIEIKSSYTLKCDNKFKYKKKHVLKEGYNFICIINKNYNKFNKLINIP